MIINYRQIRWDRGFGDSGTPEACIGQAIGSHVCVSNYQRCALPENGTDDGRRERLQTISDALLKARSGADDLCAYMLAAKIEDSRLCAEDMIDALR